MLILYVSLKNARGILAFNVRAHRLKMGLSQEALGYKCKMPDVYISKVERGVLNIGIDNLERLAKALKVKVDVLLKD